jgi:hypothetical protein
MTEHEKDRRTQCCDPAIDSRFQQLVAENERLRSILNERCLAIHIHDRTYGVRMWERWVVRELLADPWGPSTGESYELEELLAKAKEVK